MGSCSTASIRLSDFFYNRPAHWTQDDSCDQWPGSSFTPTTAPAIKQQQNTFPFYFYMKTKIMLCCRLLRT